MGKHRKVIHYHEAYLSNWSNCGLNRGSTLPGGHAISNDLEDANCTYCLVKASQDLLKANNEVMARLDELLKKGKG